MSDISNLPAWAGAGVCYSRAYRLLAIMGRRGHATPADVTSRGRILSSGWASEDMRALIEALNAGDEEAIKASLMYSRQLYGIDPADFL